MNWAIASTALVLCTHRRENPHHDPSPAVSLPSQYLCHRVNATFMGRSYARKQFTVVQRQQPEELTSRGIRYAR